MISLVFQTLKADKSFWEADVSSVAVATCVNSDLICLSLLSMAFFYCSKVCRDDAIRSNVTVDDVYV